LRPWPVCAACAGWGLRLLTTMALLLGAEQHNRSYRKPNITSRTKRKRDGRAGAKRVLDNQRAVHMRWRLQTPRTGFKMPKIALDYKANRTSQCHDIMTAPLNHTGGISAVSVSERIDPKFDSAVDGGSDTFRYGPASSRKCPGHW
jgi:hypothetical protein